MSGFEADLGMLESEMDAAVDEVYPDELQSMIRRALEGADRTPALLCLLSGRLASDEPPVEAAAGIEFVHAGLEVTRGLLDDSDAWSDVDVDPVREDLDLLAADVLVTMGFDRLLDDYRRATDVVNTFGASRARHLEDGDEHESYVETYRAAVDVGHVGEPPEFLREFAEKLAVEKLEDAVEMEEDVEPDWSMAFDEPVYDYLREIRMESTPPAESLDG